MDGADGSSPPSDQGGSSTVRVKSRHGAPKPEKDPRKVARKYQLDLCKKALVENVIVYLGTGCGKTHIAVMLIYEMRHLIRKPEKSVCVFLAPTVALVQQQAKVIEDSLGFDVGIYCGSSNQLKNHQDWEKEIEQHEVFVMTPEVLLRNLNHCFIKMESISLLIFDECHHAQVQSNHPYAEIMKLFYDANATKHPRVFGMTASPVVGKGDSSQENLSKCINSLESILDAKVYSVEDKKELDCVVSSPVITVYDYGQVISDAPSPYITYYTKLEQIKRQCIAELGKKINEYQSLRNTKKLLNRMHESIRFCLENLGLWGALKVSNFNSNIFIGRQIICYLTVTFSDKKG